MMPGLNPLLNAPVNASWLYDRSMKLSQRLLVRCSKPNGSLKLPTRRLPTSGISRNVTHRSVGQGTAAGFDCGGLSEGSGLTSTSLMKSYSQAQSTTSHIVPSTRKRPRRKFVASIKGPTPPLAGEFSTLPEPSYDVVSTWVRPPTWTLKSLALVDSSKP